MKHMNNKIVKLLHEGFSMSTLENLTEKQLNVLFHKIISEQPQPTEKTVTSKVTELPAGAKTVVGSVTVSNDAGKTVITQTQNEGELDEEEEFDSMDVKKGEDDQDPIQKQGPDGMDEGNVTEKSVSKQQQKLMGLALSVKKETLQSLKFQNQFKKWQKKCQKKNLRILHLQNTKDYL